jgi:protein-S-isoprenylcysteine O-methyltransferase Ste14
MMAKRLVRWFLAVTVAGGGLLALSGRWIDPWFWTYLAIWAALGTYAMLVLDDDLARERFRPPSPGADRLSLRFIRLIALAHLIVGALDSGRWQLAPVPLPLQAVSMIGMAASFAVVFHAMRVNRFFSAVVRIQDDRGHHVVDTGPYALVRHPGYAGMIPAMPFSALALGSWAAFIVSLVYVALILRRVVFEDAFLHAHLTGYADYARRVRYRLVPGIW